MVSYNYSVKYVYSAIPIKTELKRFLLLKFRILNRNNGAKYASDVFKDMKETLMRYRSDIYRHKRSQYPSLPIKNKHMIKLIFQYMDTQPHDTLNMLKIYTSYDKPLESKAEASLNLRRLNSREVSQSSLSSDLSSFFLRKFGRNLYINPYRSIPFLTSRVKTYDFLKEIMFSTPNHELFVRDLSSLPNFRRDIDITKGLNPNGLSFSYELSKGDTNSYIGIILSTLYKAYFNDRQLTSNSEASRFMQVMHSIYWSKNVSADVSVKSIDQSFLLRDSYWIPRFLRSDQFSTYWLDNIISPTGDRNEQFKNLYVGSVNFIPKKGTVKLRPIANPNEIIQDLSKPFSRVLYKILDEYFLFTDATFNQHKFDSKIKARLQHKEFVGSVDLSAATENLPFSYIEDLLGSLHDGIITCIDRLYHTELPVIYLTSYIAAKALLRGRYIDDLDNIQQWKHGQPLGSSPSFAILGLSHNLILSGLIQGINMIRNDSSDRLGLHSYSILGDDIVIYDEVLHNIYIEFMEYINIPLSLHKSYSGNLTEFAGKIFIKNHPVKYNTDHPTLGFNNLFDWMYSTQTFMSFSQIPLWIQKNWIKKINSNDDHLIVKIFNTFAKHFSNKSNFDSFERDLLSFYYSQVSDDEEPYGNFILYGQGRSRMVKLGYPFLDNTIHDYHRIRRNPKYMVTRYSLIITIVNRFLDTIK